MNKDTVAVYGGTFDPPTYGHWQTLNKATTIFDKVYVVIATASGKETMFTLDERKEMMLSTIPPDYWSDDGRDPQIEVVTLPDGVYLATFAEKLEADFLVRGLRDAFDFHYESQIYHTNRNISRNIETVYLMPDDEMKMVSSSWVKGMVGHYGWRNVIRSSVSEEVLAKIALKYAKGRFMKCISNLNVSWTNVGFTDAEEFWNVEVIENFHNVNAYHNVFHILDCLEALDYYAPQYGTVMEFSYWLHDLLPEPDDCVKLAKDLLANEERGFIIRQIVKLINATKHTDNWTGEIDAPDEALFASIDLLPLGSGHEKFKHNYRLLSQESMYNQYREKVLKEYQDKSPLPDPEFRAVWAKGRSDFIKAMLSRKYVYPWKPIRDEFETQARMNMTEEKHAIDAQLGLSDDA